MPDVTLNGYYVHTFCHSHFNILVTKEGYVAEFSHQNLNDTASSFNPLTVEFNIKTQRQQVRLTVG